MEQAKQYEYVDLGLPSGLKWAKCNIGAETETDYGDYFMWGSTTPNTPDECILAKAPFNGGSDRFEKKYFNAYKSEWLDDKDNLRPEYDVAYQLTDGMARMPTKDEIKELLDNTDNEWIEDYNGSGVNGRKFTSKTDETKYIFISAGKNYDDGYFWSSSLNDSDPRNAWCLWFSQIQIDINNYIRTSSYPVRGVL